MSGLRTLLLLRHAETEDVRPGGRDADRRLTTHGKDQAAAVGDFLRSSGVCIDAVLCSSAVRARQTLDLLGLELSPDRIDLSEKYYNAGSDSLIEAVRALPANLTTALLVGHAPGLPGVVYVLCDASTAERSAWTAIEHRFPAATLAHVEWAASWSDLGLARLVGAKLPH